MPLPLLPESNVISNYLPTFTAPTDADVTYARFLTNLFEQDSNLVVFYSKIAPTWVIARRTGRNIVREKHDADTKLLMRYGLVEILRVPDLDESVLRTLRASDIRRLGGVEEVLERLHAKDALRRFEIERARDVVMEQISTKAYAQFIGANA